MWKLVWVPPQTVKVTGGQPLTKKFAIGAFDHSASPDPTTDEALVERVAVAAMLACHEKQPVCSPWMDPMERWADENDPMREFWTSIARAAIRAMEGKP